MYFLEVVNINSESIIKGKVDSTLFEVLKQILAKKKMTQQDFIESATKEFVLQNLKLIISKEDKGSK